jgi:hypothetical protein
MADDSRPKKKTVSTRLPADEYERLEDYCDERSISQADALRRFISRGLDGDRELDAMPQRIDVWSVLYLLFAAAAFYAGTVVPI